MVDSSEILYEDAWMLLANKPAGIPIHETKDPNRKDFTRHLQLKYNFPTLRTVNRLDLSTSGIVVMGKDPTKNAEIDSLMLDAEKKYIFIAEGVPEWKDKTFSCFIKDGNKKVTVVRSGGKKAITVFKVLEVDVRNNRFLGEATLITGRRHQIRISLATLGHPIYGDVNYGSKCPPNIAMYLHSYQFKFRTLLGQSVTITCAPPESFQTIFLVAGSLFSNLSVWH